MELLPLTENPAILLLDYRAEAPETGAAASMLAHRCEIISWIRKNRIVHSLSTRAFHLVTNPMVEIHFLREDDARRVAEHFGLEEHA